MTSAFKYIANLCLPKKSNTLFVLLSCFCFFLVVIKASELLMVGRRAEAEAPTPISNREKATPVNQSDANKAQAPEGLAPALANAGATSSQTSDALIPQKISQGISQGISQEKTVASENTDEDLIGESKVQEPKSTKPDAGATSSQTSDPLMPQKISQEISEGNSNEISQNQIAASESPDVSHESNIIGLKEAELLANNDVSQSTHQAQQNGAAKIYNPLTLTLEEFNVLKSLSERKNALEEKEKKISLRVNYALTLEKRVKNKIDELQNIRKTIEKLLSRYELQEKENIKSLVKIYEKMKPKEAARIFSGLDMPVLLNVVSMMSESKASAIIAFMDTQRAKELTIVLSRERKKNKGPETKK